MSSARVLHRRVEGCHFIVSLSQAAVLTAVLSACSAQPQSQPAVGAPVHAAVQQTEECSTIGVMLCSAMSMLSGDAAVERGATCSAYRASNGTLVQTCGSAQAKAPTIPVERKVEAKAPTTTVEPNKAATASVRLSWSDNSSNENNFVIERCDQVSLTVKTSASCSGGWKVLGIVAANTTNYVDRTVLPNHTYIYRVKAANRAGSSGYTNEMTTTTPPQ